MPPLHVILTYREARERPIHTLARCIDCWLAQSVRPDVDLVDASSAPCLRSAPRLQVLHRPYPGRYNRSFQLNVGLRFALDAGAAFIAIGDADVFPSHGDHLARAVAELEGRGEDLATTWLRYSVLPAPRTDGARYSAFLRGRPLLLGSDKLCALFALASARFRTDYQSVSHLVMTARVPRQLHGYDEGYQGWGGEDDDFFERARAAGFGCGGLPRELMLVHSYHPRSSENAARRDGRFGINQARRWATARGALHHYRMGPDFGVAMLPNPGGSVAVADGGVERGSR